MTDAVEEMSSAAETPVRFPFDHWVDSARAKPQAWRTVVGVIIVLAVWILWTLATAIIYSIALLTSDRSLSPEDVINSLAGGESVLATLTLLAGFWGLWLGVWLAARLMHDQAFWTVVSPERQLRWREFVTGITIIAGYLAGSSIVTMGLDIEM